MIRIAVVVFSSFPRDVRVRREVEALVEGGYDVDVVCLRSEAEKSKERIGGATVYRLRVSRSRSTRLNYALEYAAFASRALLRVGRLHLTRRYRVVHCHNLPDLLVVSALVPRLTGARVVLDIHDLMPEFYMRKYGLAATTLSVRALKATELLSARFAHHVLVASPYKREKMVGRSVGPEKCTAVLNLPDLRYFANGPRCERDETEFRMVYPGSLNELHGADVAIRAVKIVKSRTNIPLHFHIMGDGSEDECSRTMALVRELGLDDCVHFEETVPLEEYVRVLARMDIGVVPKRGGVFADLAMSTKLMEFAAAGLPAVVSRTKADTYFLDDTMATFFEPGDAEALAAGIVKLCRDPDYGRRVAANAKAVTERVNWDQEKAKLLDVYRRLVAR